MDGDAAGVTASTSPREAEHGERTADGGLVPFISYSHCDVEDVGRVKRELEAARRVVWFDKDDILAGEEWPEELKAGIESADALVFFISPDSVKSPQCLDELAYARKLGKRLVPVLLHEVEAIPDELGKLHFIDATELGPAATAGLVEVAIDTDPDWVRGHTEWGKRALRWQTQKNKGYLLRGDELRSAEAWLASQPKHSEPAPTPLHVEFVVASRDVEKARLRRWLALALVAVLALAATAAFALVQRGEAKQEAQVNYSLALTARARELAAASINESERRPDTAALLALESDRATSDHERATIPETWAALHQAATSPWLATLASDGDSIASAAFSRDGARLVTESSTGAIRVWDADGHSLASPPNEEPMRHPSFSADGSRIVTVGDDGAARVWSIDGQLVATVHSSSPFSSRAELNADGSQIVTINDEGMTVGWSLSGESLFTVGDPADNATAAALSADGSLILTTAGGRAGASRVWDVHGDPVMTLGDDVLTAEFSPDGSKVLTTATDRPAELWDVRTRSSTVIGDTSFGVLSAVFAPDGSQVLTAGTDGYGRVWSLAGTELSSFFYPVPTASFYAADAFVRATYDNRGIPRIVSVSPDGTVELWSSREYSVRTFTGLDPESYEPVVSADGSRVITAGAGGSRLWDTEGRADVVLGPHGDYVSWAQFNADGSRVLTYDGGTSRLWDRAGNVVWTSVGPATFGAERTRVVTINGRGADEWSLDGRELAAFGDLGSWVGVVALSPDGSRLMATGDDGMIRIFTLDATPISAFRDHDGSVLSATFSSDGTRVVTAGDDGNARVWGTDGTLVATLTGDPQDAVSEAEFNRDGSRVVTRSASGKARVWDVEGRLLAALNVHDEHINSAVFSSDGSLIVTASDDRSARVWDRDGDLVATLAGHAGLVTAAAFSPDGALIVTASFDSTARLWDIRGETLAVFAGHMDVVKSAEFSPDGSHILTSSDDRTARIWSVRDVPDMRNAIEDRLSGRQFTAAECNQYRIDPCLVTDVG